MKKIVTIIIATFALVACGEPEKSAQYFVAHKDEIRPTLEKCASAPGAKNCAAAEEARLTLWAQKTQAEMAAQRELNQKAWADSMDYNKYKQRKQSQEGK